MTPSSLSDDSLAAWQLDHQGFDEAADPATAFFESESIPRSLAAHSDRLPVLPDDLFTLEHRIPIGDGRFLHATEHFTLSCWHRWPRRAALMLGGPVTLGNYWSIPSAGYHGTEMVARRGLFAFTVDYLGYGKSYKPGSGKDISFDEHVDALRHVLRYIRFFRAVPAVDIIAESLGGASATQLAADAKRVRRVTISTVLYKTLVDQKIVSPEFSAFLDSWPNGYTQNPPESYDQFLADSPDEDLRNYTYESQPGAYPIAPFQWIKKLPYFDPGLARAPGKIIVGKHDFVPGPDDPKELAADYGENGAELVVLEDAGHVPRLENQQNAADYWREVFAFIES